MLFGGRLQPAEIGVNEDGRIVRIAKSIPTGRRWEFGDRVIVPAATDLHVHLREPGGPHDVEDALSGTEAAAVGGVTAVGDMPNTDPPITTRLRFEEKATRLSGRLAVDVVAFAALRPETSVLDLGSIAGSWKLYLSPTTGMEEGVPRAEVRALLASATAGRIPVTVHAETAALFRHDLVPRNSWDWSTCRPPESERVAVSSLLPAPEGIRLNIAHVTEAETAEAVRAAGHLHEVTPHHLLLSAREDRDGRWKTNPPLRPEADRGRLWEAFAAGRIPVVASDHAPHAVDAKTGAFEKAPSGVPGVETMLPVLLEKVRSAELGLDVLQSAACDRPARWFGLDHGRLAPGHRANFLVVDFSKRSTIRGDRLRTRCGWTPFEGWPAIFPVAHFRDGVPLVTDGSFVGAHAGRVVRPEYAREPDPPTDR